MKVYPLNSMESVFHGYTHKIVISHADGDFSAAATSQSYTVFTLAAGQIVRAAARKLVTGLVGASVTAGAGILGDETDDNGFLVSSSVLTADTPITYQTGDGALFNQAGGEVYTAADSVIYKISLTGANVSVLSAGEIHLYLWIDDLTKI